MFNRTPTKEVDSFSSPVPQSLQFESPSRTPATDSRFTPNSFQYNGRVAVALVPCILVLLGAGGTVVMGTLVVGLMISYILDALQFKQGAFLGIWGTFFGTAAAVAFSGVGFGPHMPTPLSILIVLTCFHLIFLCGVWTSLQFKWLQLEHPSVVVALERILFACCPFTASAIQTWGIIAAVGMAYAPFYLMPILFGFYWLFSLPCTSSFRSKADRSFGGQLSVDDSILAPLERCIHTILLLTLPATLHFAIHHAMILHTLNELCDHLLLFFVPLLYILFTSTRGGLSWLYRDPRQVQQARLLSGFVSLAVVLACVEIRVIFHSFSQYIHLPAPWNYALVTLAMYGLGLGAAAHVFGLIKGMAGKVVVTGTLLVSAIAGSLVLGMPWQMLPAPALAAVYLAQFYSTGSISAYAIFSVATSLAGTWFLVHNFWYLDFSLGGLLMHEVINLLVASLVLALAVPGAALFPKGQLVVGLIFIAQAALVCRVEDAFYNVGHDEEGLYPSYLVIGSSVAGFLAARRLEADKKMGPWAAWIGSCLYLAKLPMLLVTSDHVVWASALLMLAVTPPFLLYKDKPKGADRMKTWQGIAHAGAILVAVWLSRYTLFDALLWWTGHRPSHSVLLGLLLLAFAAACAPIVTINFSHVHAARRAIVLLVASALLILFLQPPIPVGGHLIWDVDHTPDVEPDDAAIYGSTVAPSWSAWLLLVAIVATMAAFTRAIPVEQVAALRVGYALGMGAAVGVYVCVQFFSQAPLVHLLLVAASECVAVFLVFTHLPTSWSPQVLPGVFALLVALLPVTWLALGVGVRKMNGDSPEEVDYLADMALQELRNSLVGVYCAVFLMVALVIKLKLASLLRDKHGGQGGRGLPNTSPFAPKHRNIQRRTNFFKGFTVKKLSAEGAWMPITGNVATLLCFALALYLNNSLTQSSDKSIFAIAPVLLLLNQDATLLSSFNDRQRYFPLTLAISSYLVAISLWRLLDESWYTFQEVGISLAENFSLLAPLKDFGLLLLTLPNHAAFNKYMWDFARQSDYLLLLVTPLNLPAMLLPESHSVRALGFVGLIYAVAQFMISRHVRLVGLKYI